ncbi:transposase [Microbacterium sp. CnD16-F]|uniref:transposase n=1 Tax=Microbacterium sp. CnD16-F TaxID=2954493 RepID=UPI0035AB81B6
MRHEISDEAWAVMEPLMPTVTGRSRPWTNHRLAVEGMAWKYRTGAPWRVSTALENWTVAALEK